MKYFYELRPVYCIVPFTNLFKKSENPLDTLDSFVESKRDTGTDRIYAIFQRGKFGELSPELVSISQLSTAMFIAGLLIGGLRTSRTSVLDYINKHEASQYVSPWHAKRMLQDHVTAEFFKGGIIFGIRGAIFTAMSGLIIVCISAYRGKTGIIEFGAGMALAGAISKIHQGLKASVSGCLVGSALGFFFGSLMYLWSKISGITVDEFRKWQYDIEMNRKNKLVDIIRNENILEDRPLFLKLRDESLKRTEDSNAYSNLNTVYIAIPDESEKELINSQINLNTSQTSNDTTKIADMSIK